MTRCRDRLAAFRAAGLDLPILYAPVGVDAARALSTDFGNEPLHRAYRSKERCHPRCFRPLKAVQITLIGDAEFVVPPITNWHRKYL